MPALSRALATAIATAAIAVGAVAAIAGEPLIYTASYADGLRVVGGQLTEWHAQPAAAKLNGKPLFDPANPVRWLRAAPLGGMLPAAAGTIDSSAAIGIEFFGGDRLPCTVVEYRSGTEDWRERLPPHLVVRPLVGVDLAGKPPRSTLRVAVDTVRRIVWKPREGRPTLPSTLRLTDGRTIPFRSLRFSQRGLLVLHEQATERVAFDEIADLQMPARDGWDAYFDNAASLVPDGTGLLMRVETTGGLVATASLERCRATGNPGDPRSWQHLVQPAWCLDPLWLVHPEIRMRLFFAPYEVPLSLIAPAAVRRDAKFGGGWAWQTDRSVQGTPLEARRTPLDPLATPFGWGFGVQARCDLVFPVPPIATAFRTAVALDALARSGGCARASVHLKNAATPPLWQSGFLVGSTDIADSGSLPLVSPDGGPATTTSLVLVADMAHDGRPTGADPFDIRDLVDWLEPVVSLDPARLTTEIQARLPATIPAWQGFRLDTSEAAPLVVKNAVDPAAAAEIAGYRRLVIRPGAELALDRTWTVTADQPYLAIAVTRPPGTSASRIEVRIDGQSVAVADVPERKPGQLPPPFLLSLARFMGRTIDAEIVHLPTDDKSLVEWHAVGPIADPGTRWQPVEIVELKSEGGSTFTRLDDGSILVGGPSPATDVHTMLVRVADQTVTAIRLEALPHDLLPAGGPGRSGSGNFVLGMVETETLPAADAAKGQKITIAKAETSYTQPGHTAAMMIDADPRSGWAVGAAPKQTPLAAVLTMAAPVRFAGGSVLRLTLRYPHGDQHQLGRFRLSVTTDPQPALGLPGTLLVDRLARP